MPPSEKKKLPKRRSSSFPPQFLQVLMHVASTGQSLRVDTLSPNERTTYTSFRARMNEFRRAYYNEAIAGLAANRSLDIAEELYRVVLREPSQDANGRWGIMLDLKEQGFAEGLEAALAKVGAEEEEYEAPEKDDEEEGEEGEEEKARAQAAINQLYSNK